MRILSKAAVAVTLSAPLVALLAVPASAGPLGTCPGGEPTCIYVSGTYPIGNPVATGPYGSTAYYAPGPRVCDSTGTQCLNTFVGVPGFMVSSSGGTFGTLNVPGLGIGISSTGQVTVYATTLPTFTPGGTGSAGITASVTVQDLPVWVSPTFTSLFECADPSTTSAGPVTYSQGGCAATITFTV